MSTEASTSNCTFFWNWMVTRCGCAPSDLQRCLRSSAARASKPASARRGGVRGRRGVAGGGGGCCGGSGGAELVSELVVVGGAGQVGNRCRVPRMLLVAPHSERRPAPDLDPAGAGGGGDRRAEECRRGEATEVRPSGSGEPNGSARLGSCPLPTVEGRGEAARRRLGGERGTADHASVSRALPLPAALRAGWLDPRRPVVRGGVRGEERRCREKGAGREKREEAPPG
jgi:hypothetical protein